MPVPVPMKADRGPGPRCALRRRMLAAAAVVFGLAASLLVAEVALRSVVGLELLPDDHGFVVFLRRLQSEPVAGSIYRHSNLSGLGIELVPSSRSHHIRINSLGFRGPEIEARAPSGVARVVVLGDSETFGALLEEGDTLPGRLEAELTQTARGRRFEVLNLGCPGYNTLQESVLLRSRVMDLEPSIVILYYVLNDAFLGTQTTLVHRSPLLRSYVGVLATFLATRNRPSYYQLLHHRGDLAAQLEDVYGSEEFAQTRLVIRQMAAFLDRRGVRFVLVIAPETIGFDDFASYPYCDIHARLGALRSQGIEVVDPLDDLATLGFSPRELWVAPTDCHKNAVASAAIAGAVARHLLSQPASATAPACPEPDSDGRDD